MFGRFTSTPNGPRWERVWVKPIAAIAQIVSGMHALVWTELATDRSKHARLTLAETRVIIAVKHDQIRQRSSLTLAYRTTDFELYVRRPPTDLRSDDSSSPSLQERATLRTSQRISSRELRC